MKHLETTAQVKSTGRLQIRSSNRVAARGAARVPAVAALLCHCALLATALLGMPGGCATATPRMLPIAPLAEEEAAGGLIERRYDTGSDGRADYAEVLTRAGRVVALRYDLDDDGRFELDVERATALAEAGNDVRHLVILLDSVPYRLVHELRQTGRFALFEPPARVISPFPAMTDTSYAEFFGVAPCLAVESQFYNGQQLNDGLGAYARGEIMGWMKALDFHLPPIAHMFVYSSPDEWFDHELGRIETYFFASGAQNFIGYSVAPSALGSARGRNAHLEGLIRLDRMCGEVMRRCRGRVQITLLADHGHHFARSRRVALSDELARMGYTPGTRLEDAGDVAVPEFGNVSYAGIYTKSPAAVARDAVHIEGVDFASYLDEEGRVVVLSRAGRAHIARAADAAPRPGAGSPAFPTGPQPRFRYALESGDPLQLRDVVRQLQASGRLDSAGFAADATWFAATHDHVYPDPLHRLWRGFHGLVRYPPDVLLSLQDGYHCGDTYLSERLAMQAVHGGLGRESTETFAMTTAAALPEVVRMEDLAETLRSAGVPIPRPETNSAEPVR